MIYAFEKLSELDWHLLVMQEPFIDFSYESKTMEYSFQHFHIIQNGKHSYKQRLWKLDQLRQGFICTDWYEARELSMVLDGTNYNDKLCEKYHWIQDYIQIEGDQYLKHIAIPLSIYIGFYSNNYERLSYVDIDEACSGRFRQTDYFTNELLKLKPNK